jgi:hypothetical protein
MKPFLVMLALLSVGLLAGCGANGENPSSTVNTGTETPKPGESTGVPEGEK